LSCEHRVTNEQLETKIATATKTYQTWKTTPYPQRAVILAKAAELMHADVDKFAKLASLERWVS
jgi:succinate-semialdehyde dehydrogenase/glutarate-semialdehyde dehydrogenase